MNNYAAAKEALQKIFRQLERINPSATLVGHRAHCCFSSPRHRLAPVLRRATTTQISEMCK